MTKILILGATGTVGSHLVKILSENDVQVHMATRYPSSAIVSEKIRQVKFDLTLPETFNLALNGMDKVFMIARPGDDFSDQVAKPFIDAMCKNGIKHVVNLTAFGVGQHPEFVLRRVELLLENSGLSWTHLRPNIFMQMFLSTSLRHMVSNQGLLQLPAENAKVSFIHARDIAEVAALALLNSCHEGSVYELTGPDSLDYYEVASLFSQALKKSIRYIPISETAAFNNMLGADMKEENARRLLKFYKWVRAGACAPVHSTVSNLLERSPLSFLSFVEEAFSSKEI